MAEDLAPAKVILLAVELAAKADTDSLAALASQHSAVLRKEILLRILLTYLPETLPSTDYVSFLKQIELSEYSSLDNHTIDIGTLGDVSDSEATRRVRKLRLLPLAAPNSASETARDALTRFLLHRAYRVDEEAGLLDQLPALITPFYDHSPELRRWMVSTLLPWVRRNVEYHPQSAASQTLLGFEQLPDRDAVELLLRETGVREEELGFVGRDLRGLVGPWLQSDTRWRRNREPSPEAQLEGEGAIPNPGWDEVLQWLVRQASTSWPVAVAAVEQWHGPSDVDLGRHTSKQRDEEEGHQHMVESYARAALAVANLIPEASTEALTGAYVSIAKVRMLLGNKASSPIHTVASTLPPIVGLTNLIQSAGGRNLAWLRTTPLDADNPLTLPSQATTDLLGGLALSAFLLTRAGAPCSMRRAGELFFLQDEREQKSEALKMIHAIGNHGPKTEDSFWEKARKEVLWLRDWASQSNVEQEEAEYGVFSQLKKSSLEVEVLKVLLSSTRKRPFLTVFKLFIANALKAIPWLGLCMKAKCQRHSLRRYCKTLSSVPP
jgi:protein transport protein SEC39